jgi:hypothetical protein
VFDVVRPGSGVGGIVGTPAGSDGIGGWADSVPVQNDKTVNHRMMD